MWLSGGGCGWKLLVWLVGVFLIYIYIMLLLELILYLCVDLLICYVKEHGWAISFNILLL